MKKESLKRLFREAKTIKQKYNLSAEQIDEHVEEEIIKINKRGAQKQ